MKQHKPIELDLVLCGQALIISYSGQTLIIPYSGQALIKSYSGRKVEYVFSLGSHDNMVSFLCWVL